MTLKLPTMEFGLDIGPTVRKETELGASLFQIPLRNISIGICSGTLKFEEKLARGGVLHVTAVQKGESGVSTNFDSAISTCRFRTATIVSYSRSCRKLFPYSAHVLKAAWAEAMDKVF